ncbi:GIY-YIG nuclease family protein [Microbacterium hydrocarbonoxydans]|uniref:GIY-YIG nuclease family protein n=1 Tax=Microbacterium hydrocarbonoxydans TaxID=273678 RepID=UPI002040A02B|nr:GIY-YIG nuclease family protein [Microbacterium hydrocarbonoxydans]MCM3780422.1 GIY-YIG nuclease family protein [Microbacterium hydrocarbonoxydans]
MPRITLPDPCSLCGRLEADRLVGRLVCAWCGWRRGDAPDADLPRPVVEVVYYLRFDRRVKIGTSGRPRQRLAAIRHDELLAFEPGGRDLEQARHREFASIREGGEWFTLTAELEYHVAALRTTSDPWQLYARWVAAAMQR